MTTTGPLEEWSMADVQTWLSTNKREEFRSLAPSFPLSGESLAGFSKGDLERAIGILLGSAMYNAIQELRKPAGNVLFLLPILESF